MNFIRNNEMPTTFEINPSSKKANYCIIWLHGLGASGEDFLGLEEYFNFIDKFQVKMIFPNAPIRAITVNNGMKMPGWYDIKGMDIDSQEDEFGIKDSAQLIINLIKRENLNGIPSSKIFLAGFSQGGAMSLYLGLRYKEKLAGIIALSTYLPIANKLKEEIKEINKEIPIFMAHGLFDPVVPLSKGKLSCQKLEDIGCNIEFYTYPIQHTVTPEELMKVSKFITDNIE